jgi:hypothetical protein
MEREERKYKDHKIVINYYGKNPYIKREYLVYDPQGKLLNSRHTITRLEDAKAQVNVGRFNDYQ